MKEKKETSKDRVDWVAAEVIRSSALTFDEADAAVESPLLLSRVRRAISSERHRKAQSEWSHPQAFAVGKLKLAFAGLATAAAVTFWIVRIPTASALQERTVQAEAPATLTACSISATSACAISTGDVLQLLLSNNIQELPK